MRCTRCGHDNRAQARYCDACGAALPVPDDDAAAPAAARAAELAALDARLARMAGGRGAIVALAGEPGIGKTHTAQALAAHAAGMRVLWGRCNEEPGAPPYWPWLQILRAWLEAHDDDALRAALGTGAAPIAAILPEIGQRLPGLAPPAPTPDAQQQRFRLFDAIAGFFRRAAAAEPLLLIIDNLHWADASSLRLLEFVAPEIDARPARWLRSPAAPAWARRWSTRSTARPRATRCSSSRRRACWCTRRPPGRRPRATARGRCAFRKA